ncbi:MAG3450 family membrane protein [Mycoplasmopsis gallinarum]|uniref:MAG3450 family membrane protein n=1 Tax=Mycoplasmopsis gallinarum TaxID=29557 RepID=UPI00138AFBE5|nr:hypothetical protein [Mycoplasmopsis gallinarum]
MNKKKYSTNYRPLYTFLFIAFALIIPLFIIYILGTKDMGNQLIKPEWLTIIYAAIITVIAFVINWLLIKYDKIKLQSLNFSIPIAILFISIIALSYIPDLALYIKIIIVLIIVIATTLFFNFLIGRWIEKHKVNKKQN